MSLIGVLFKAMRPYQWVKNVLLFSGLIFSLSLFQTSSLLKSLMGFVVFCLISSGIYLINDIRDFEEDRNHPVKKNRPIASGKLKLPIARVFATILVIIAFVLSYFLNKGFTFLVAIYFLNNLAYSFGLKKVAILDVMMVSFGFLLRPVAGCVVIGVQVSPWLFICSLMFALLFSFGKRRNELSILKRSANKHRKSLQDYTVYFLDIMMAISGGLAIGTFALYTMAAETVERFGTQRLIITTPFVLYGVFRYFFLVHLKSEGGDPTKLLTTDIPTLVNGALFGLMLIYVIYGTKVFPIFHV